MTLNIMKKKILFAAGAMIIAAAVSAAVCLNFGQTRHDDLFEQNLDALADGEDNKLTRGYTSGEKWVMTTISVGYPPEFQTKWEKVKCCVESTPMDGCDFSMEDQRCD